MVVDMPVTEIAKRHHVFEVIEPLADSAAFVVDFSRDVLADLAQEMFP
jgi:hypothetical protein